MKVAGVIVKDVVKSSMSRPLRTRLRNLVSGIRVLIQPLALLISGVLFQTLASFVPWQIERFYTRPIYPRVLSLLSPMSRRFTFSVGEVLTCLSLLIGCALAVLFCIGMVRRWDVRKSWVMAWLRYAAWVGAGLLWAFLFAFGLNYQRPLLFDLLGYEQRSAGPRELGALSRLLVENINQSYTEAHAEGRSTPESGEIVKLLNESYDSIPEFKLLPRGDFAQPKPVYASEVLTRLGISGVYSPFTGEPNYNADIPDFQLPFTIAHEMAHQRGVARESEANFVAYVVCISSRDPFVRYSGYRNGLGVLSELFKADPEKARELARQLGPGFKEDSRRAALFWAKASGAAGALSHRMNDLYLRANRVKAGVADYGNSTTLIIAYHLRQGAADEVKSTL
ncbi:MAG: DUF3810 domain-containing protein [Pyrinomonadaceae bacterium]